MGRSIHARVITSSAVVAEVRQEKHVAPGEVASNFDSWKYRTIAFAITTGVADGQLSSGFTDELIRRGHA
jgi:hypothetical protein